MEVDPLLNYSDLTAEGNILVRRGDFRRAIDNFERAKRLAEEMQDHPLLIKALCNLSTARLAAGDIREAEKGLREILLKTRDPQTVFVTSSNLASALRRQGRLDRALLYAKRALRACDQIDNYAWKATCHNLIGNIYMNMTYLDDAVAEYRFALVLSEKGGLGTSYPVDYIKENLGYCLLLKKRYRQGIAIILEALQVALKNGNTRCISECYQDLSSPTCRSRNTGTPASTARRRCRSPPSRSTRIFSRTATTCWARSTCSWVTSRRATITSTACKSSTRTSRF